MKKLFLLSSAAYFLAFGAAAQIAKHGSTSTKGLAQLYPENFKTLSTNTVYVTDTLHYYLNKFYFKTAATDYSNFPYYTSVAATSTAFTHVGSRFDVPAGETVTVTGLETYGRRITPAPNLTISVHLYLCNLDGNGMPDVVHPIDSAISYVAGNQIMLVGGNLMHGPKTMTNNFAVLARNTSTSSVDQVALLRTAGTTATNTTSQPNTKYADRQNNQDYGFVRYNYNFYSTRDFSLFPGFGVGTAYEFMVAPRVVYKLQASEKIPAFAAFPDDTTGHGADTICTREIMTFTNTSSAFFEHRQYNLNQFYRKWNLGSPIPASFASQFATDSSICWSFEFYDAETNPPRDSRVFLPYVNTETISASTSLSYYPLCFTGNHFRAHLKPMGAKSKMPQIVFSEDFIICLKYCDGEPPIDTTVGIVSMKGYENLSLYPNPTINGKISLSGLKGKNALSVYDILGQCILKEITEKERYEINLTEEPKGTYVLRITNTENQTKTIKIINEN